MRDDKKELRNRVRMSVDALPQADIDSSDERIFGHVLSLPEYAAARTVFAYCSTGREPDTLRIIDDALLRGKTVLLPLITGDGLMEPRAIGSRTELTPGKYGIPAPPGSAGSVPEQEIDLILVPAVAFDRDGYRLGRGGGFYDRFLAGTGAFSVGLCREAALLTKVPREKHDLPVMCIITEKRIARPFKPRDRHE